MLLPFTEGAAAGTRCELRIEVRRGDGLTSEQDHMSGNSAQSYSNINDIPIMDCIHEICSNQYPDAKLLR